MCSSKRFLKPRTSWDSTGLQVVCSAACLKPVHFLPVAQCRSVVFNDNYVKQWKMTRRKNDRPAVAPNHQWALKETIELWSFQGRPHAAETSR